MSISSVLNAVATAGQARAAIGEGLNAIGRTYPLLGKMPDDRARSGRGELDTDRVALEGWYREIKDVSYSASFKDAFAKKRKLLEHAYVVIAGIEGEASYVPQTTNLQILTDSLKEAPKVFAQAAGSVTSAVGEAAGSAVGGAISGLGISGTLTLVLVGAVLIFVLKPGLLLGLFGGSK